MMRWSSSPISSSCPAATISTARATAAAEGMGSPDGWLWTATMAVTCWCTASRKTSLFRRNVRPASECDEITEWDGRREGRASISNTNARERLGSRSGEDEPVSKLVERDGGAGERSADAALSRDRPADRSMIVGLHDLGRCSGNGHQKEVPGSRASSQGWASSVSWCCWRRDWHLPGSTPRPLPFPHQASSKPRSFKPFPRRHAGSLAPTARFTWPTSCS
jgi:hypothetical protein